MPRSLINHWFGWQSGDYLSGDTGETVTPQMVAHLWALKEHAAPESLQSSRMWIHYSELESDPSITTDQVTQLQKKHGTCLI